MSKGEGGGGVSWAGAEGRRGAVAGLVLDLRVLLILGVWQRKEEGRDVGG
jgi:hypothetical protein